MKNIITFILIMFQVSYVFANGCNTEDLIKKLETLGIPVQIKSNKSLLNEIKMRYGNDMQELLLSKHPALNSKEDITLDTLNWVLEQIEESNLHRYLYTPFSNDFDTLSHEMFSIFLQKEPATFPMFFDQKQFNKFKDYLDDNRELNISIFAATHKLSESEIADYYSEFVKKFTEVGYVKFTNDQQLNPVIHVVGHGTAGDDAIYNSVGDYMFAFQVIEQLKKMDIPNTATIKLDFCWSACSINPPSLTKAQALDLINKGDFEILFGEIDGSFYKSFLDELEEYFPEFSGTVFGYRGTVMTSIQSNVLSLSGETGRFHAVELNLSDGHVFFKKDEMSISTKIN